MSESKTIIKAIEVNLCDRAISILVQRGSVRVPVERGVPYSDNGLTADSEIQMLEITRKMVMRAIWCHFPGMSFYASLVGVGAVEVLTSRDVYDAVRRRER